MLTAMFCQCILLVPTVSINHAICLLFYLPCPLSSLNESSNCLAVIRGTLPAKAALVKLLERSRYSLPLSPRFFDLRRTSGLEENW
jgi:hypothetical protein